jgi:glycosyltransferase involved in cell wall biosynthesis
MKIVMVGTDFGVKGGISTVVSNYFQSALVKNHHMTYLSSHIDGSSLAKLKQFISAFFKAVVCFPSSQIVHIHSASRASFFRKTIFFFMAKLFRKKIIFHIHGAEFNDFFHVESGPLRKAIIRIVLKRADCVIALSSQWKSDFSAIAGCEKNIRVLYNSVHLPSDPRRTGNLPLTVLFMGRLERRKGVYDLLNVAEALVSRNKDIKFIFCGDGNVKEIKDWVADRGLTEHMEVTGWITDKAVYYSDADIYCLPSYNEGLPMSILEAMSYGLPVVSTPVGGIPEAVFDGVNGFLVEPGDQKGFTAKLEILIQSPELRRKMGQESRRIAEEKFNIDSTVLALDGIYREMTAV